VKFLATTGAFLLAAASLLVGCGGGFTSDDTTTNTVAARAEARQLEACAEDDAGACTPSFIRASSALAYCANARALAAHGAPVPEGGVACQPR
jgi:hypothetical protein